MKTGIAAEAIAPRANGTLAGNGSRPSPLFTYPGVAWRYS